MNGNGQLIERLAGSEIFHDYERAFTETTGLPLALRGVETRQLPLHEARPRRNGRSGRQSHQL